MDRKYLALALLGAAGLSACSTTRTTEPIKPLAESPIAAVSPLKEAPLGNLPATTEPEVLSLRDALALTLERSPELQSYSQSIRVGEARVLQAGLIPNPEISFTVEDAFSTYGNESYSQATLQLSQLIEIGGKRSARLGAAKALRDQFKDEYEIKRVEVLSSLTDKFIRTVSHEHMVMLAQKGESLAREALQNIQRRSQAGGASGLEESKARVLVARSQIAAEHAEHELLTSKRELAAFWGEDTPKFSKISTNLFQDTALPTFESLVARIEESPEIKKWITEKRLREAEKKLADTKAIPDLLLGAGPRRLQETSDTSWVFQVSMPLNIFDRNQGARQEAAVLQDKVSFDQDASRIRLKTTLFSLYQEAKHAQVELELMKKEILPQAEQALKTAQNGYEQGTFSYLDLIDSQRTLLEVYRENIEAAYRFHSLINSIERLLGSPLSEDSK